VRSTKTAVEASLEQSRSVRKAAKAIVESTIGSRGAARHLATLLEPRVLVLAFHNVIPDAEVPRGDRSLHLPFSRFRAILDWLPELYDLVPAGDAFDHTMMSGSRPRAAITFDDAYAGAISLAIPEVVRRGLPATIFVIAGARDGQTFWWDSLSDPDVGLSSRVRNMALSEGRGHEETVRSMARANGWKLRDLNGPFVAANWEDIVASSELPGIDVAHHSCMHSNAAVLDRTNLLSELKSGRRELEKKLPQARPWLAWPYGRSSARARAIAMESGYEMAFRVDGGALRATDPPAPRFRLPRLNVPSGLSLEGLRLRAAGLLGR